MLCYQYYRNATDIVHDSFRWLRDNGRVVRVLTLVLLPLSSVAAWLAAAEDGYDAYRVDGMMRNYLPIFSDMPTGTLRVYALQSLTLLAVVVCLVPILRHYFLTRRSVRGMTLQRMGELQREHWRAALGAGVLAVVAFVLGTILMRTVVLGLILMFLAIFPMSASVVRGMNMYFEGLADNFLLTVRYLLLTAFVVLVLQLLPLYIFGVVALVTEILEETMGFDVPYGDATETVVTFIMSVLSYLMFGYSMLYLYVSLTLFHGTVAEEEYTA